MGGAAVRLSPMVEEVEQKSIGFTTINRPAPPPDLTWRMRRESWIAHLAVLTATNRPLPSCVPAEEKQEAFDLIMRARIRIEMPAIEAAAEPVENDGDTR